MTGRPADVRAERRERPEADLVAEIRVIHARSRGALWLSAGRRQAPQAGPPGEPQAVERLMAKHGIRGRCGRRRVRTTIRDPHATPATTAMMATWMSKRMSQALQSHLGCCDGPGVGEDETHDR